MQQTKYSQEVLKASLSEDLIVSPKKLLQRLHYQCHDQTFEEGIYVRYYDR